MDHFIVSLNAVMPTFLLMAAGFLLRHLGIVSAEFLKQANKVTFSVFLPVMLFRNIYPTDLSETFDVAVVFMALGCLVILFFILWFTVPHVVHDPKRQGVVMQGIFRSNYLIFGVSIVTNMFGSEKAALAAMLSAVLVPAYNFMAVVVLAVFTNKGKVSKKETVLSILKNPLILASVLGVIVAALGIDFPEFLDNSFKQLGGIATPLALIVLGGDFQISALKGRFATALTVSLIKLIAVPAVMVPIAVAMGFRNEVLMSVVLAGASPVAVSSYIMSQQAGADHELAGQIVMISSFLCLFTMFGWVYLLRSMGLV